ncbi:MAG: bifunctional fucokinase/L-fucose-1-P-guanylyltransferase [Lentisphaerae bacterium]|nr:bifunctional fucokinase/L-fucose-1-P-guanylyltransferase [Lentisphaerota bacterium]MBT4815254.1 bifunctional fucokinase/L-fucose-1-P-guanylyltransferase [Lentisphaerota bacterium]MBT5608801.1 bifunctional fucokinase/L-fucose-1-P-guanylyltransferase [Lentisphaerota bacterium]MBT7058312.1 bifunctional fucokinase/L-fucose-1-P-guanylyltransferase [Lentisphaerota bacterium]MBT7840287.1 bifunctional fucokinase/L-fucose-1-P-guanylyltransferase [Lentisphaerota bacterium]
MRASGIELTDNTDCLVSLPPAMAGRFCDLHPSEGRRWFAACDPDGRRLGSGGGTVHVLREAWRASQGTDSFRAWIRRERKLIIHGGGQSRRLPSYAAVGKPLMPMPALRWALGQRVDQCLLDLQVEACDRILERAASPSRVMITSGDVLVHFEPDFPDLPDADIVCLGLWGTAEDAQHFGVFFCPRQCPGELAFVLQKPSIDEIRQSAGDHLFLLDSGVWLLSERALAVLFAKSGACIDGSERESGQLAAYDLYGDLGPKLGKAPTVRDDAVFGELTSAVVPLPGGEFYHFGTTRDVIRSTARLQNRVLDQRRFAGIGSKPHPSMFVQNTALDESLPDTGRNVWVENSHVPRTWQLSHDHCITGVPENGWTLSLEPGTCVDFVPVHQSARWCLRVHGMDDTFSGACGASDTTYLGRPLVQWLADRGLDLGAAGIVPDTDIQRAPLFPVVELGEITGAYLEWLSCAAPRADSGWRERWLSAPRLSAAELGEQASLDRLYSQRRAFLKQALPCMAENHDRSVFYRLDLAATSAIYVDPELPVPELPSSEADVMKSIHARMFRSALLRERSEDDSRWEKEAFEILREAMTDVLEHEPVCPERQVMEDQIVWARCPVRLDLAGGWTDTPPYCHLFGGRVVNLAVDLNGQPPLQVFIRPTERPEFVLRSIDQSREQRITTYEEIAACADISDAFSIAKAALALAGFLPPFHAQGGYASLRDQLIDFGGGLELTVLAAVPRGSGLGTSSILAAVALGALSDCCGLGWGHTDVCARTLVLEQMLTTGGGWQDQVGGVLRGAKLLESHSGFDQRPAVNWLPGHLFEEGPSQGAILLYYTGVTRVAKQILQEIVRNVFLNSRPHLAILREIGENALRAAESIQRADYDALCSSVNASWCLNQRLDAGTNPEAIQAILDSVSDWLCAAKLLGAGGGGYLLMLAKDEECAGRIRRRLTECPPNGKARFVSLSLSRTGLEVTRS